MQPQTTIRARGLLFPVNADPGKANSSTRLRYHAVLSAPTGMIRGSDQIPITYLNKSQLYTISIADPVPSSALALGAFY
jgi:CP2 transcription factor